MCVWQMLTAAGVKSVVVFGPTEKLNSVWSW